MLGYREHTYSSGIGRAILLLLHSCLNPQPARVQNPLDEDIMILRQSSGSRNVTLTP
jgi:hypothetical protein